ncbi:Plastocyanin [Halogranum amylolyticum]|uniref:Plastocyanin n=1 Tax=Halogranum amylolyticum TaxID=660520 RepID=A0A1H8QYU2_9EURY|nr:plastocyanin/azurin family copper-binding protein [Halogranum amylolyticum]SEO58833.1 Plastocyanin [Halogranum amylolyticum]
MRLTRRDALARVAATTAVGGITGVAGCTGGTGGTTEETTEATTATTTAAATPTATAAETGTGTSTPTRGEYTVGMYTDLYFDPVGLHVEPGETVSFELVSGAHSATAYHPDNENAFERRIPEGAPAWDTGVFGEVGAFRNVTFETEGTHDYYCIPHKMVGMVGRIVVGSPGGPAEESENPDFPLPDSTRITEEGSIAFDDWQSEQQ